MKTKIHFIADYKIKGVEDYASISDVIKTLKGEKLIGLDIETSRNPEAIGQYGEGVYKGGLDPRLSNLVMLQLGTLDNVFVVDVRCFTKEELQPIIDYLHWNNDVTFVGVNLGFENKFLRHHLGVRIKEVYDCMIAEAALYNGLNVKLSLLELSIKYLDAKKKENIKLFEDTIDYSKVTLDSDLIEFNEHLLTPFDLANDIQIDKSTRMQFVRIGDRPFTKEQVLYGADDIVYPILIREKQSIGHMNLTGSPYRPLSNLRLESKFCLAASDMEYNGLPFNQESWMELYEKNLKIFDERKDTLDKWVVENVPDFVQFDMFTPIPTCIIDWSSPAQVIKFFKTQGVEVREKSKQTKRMELTVGAEALKATLPMDLADAYGKDKWHDIVDVETLKLAYLLVRKSMMNITSFGKDFLKYVHPITGRLHPNYRTHLNTARTATTNPNLLAIPGTHRAPFSVEHIKGRKMNIRDFSSQESRVVAHESKDPFFINFFNEGSEEFGDDFHSYTSALIHKTRYPNSDLKIVPKEDPKTGERHPDFTSEMAELRQSTKTVNFGLVYGMSSFALSRKLGITKEEAEDFMESYFDTFTELNTFLKSRREEGLKNGYFEIDKKLHSMFFYPNFQELTEMEDEIKSYFFTEEYRELSKVAREEFKAELYAEKQYLKENMSNIGRMRTSLGNKACNYIIQGTSAKQSKLSLVRMREWKVENDCEEWLSCLLLHDEIVSECPESIAELVDEKVSFFMKDSAEYFCPSVTFKTSGGTFNEWQH